MPRILVTAVRTADNRNIQLAQPELWRVTGPVQGQWESRHVYWTLPVGAIVFVALVAGTIAYLSSPRVAQTAVVQPQRLNIHVHQPQPAPAVATPVEKRATPAELAELLLRRERDK